MNKKYFSFLFLLFIISISKISSLENEYINSFAELQELINKPEFQEYLEEKELEESELKGLFDGDECLMPKKEATKVLQESYGLSVSDPDENLRFILGKCNPVLLIPGIYSTKLKVELQCKNIATEEKYTTLRDIRLYCGNTICQDETKEREEHAIFMGILEDAFTIVGTELDKYSSCLGFFMNFFQSPNECPSVNNKNICFYSKYIKVGYYGSTTDTVGESRCGVEGIQNVIQTGFLTIDNIINFGAARCFHGLAKNFINRGYNEGFSLGAVPNDFRRYLATNNFATRVFESQINRLYSNTGKPVVIVAHSYGTLLTLTNLIKNRLDSGFLKKIKKFVAIAPPFAGATKLLDAFFHGLNDWNKDVELFGKKIRITNYNMFGQLFMYKSLPTITELRPLSIATKILTDPQYATLGEAIKQRLDIERECKSQNCPINYIRSKTVKFDNIFKDYFPSLTDEACQYESSIGGNTETYSRKCYTNIYNIAECPTLVTKSENPTQQGLNNDEYCGRTGPNYYYQGECTSDRNCLDEMYSADNKCPNVFDNTEAVNFLLNRFNDNYASIYGRLDSSIFDSYDRIKEGVKKSIRFQDNKSLIKDLPLPPIDTDIVYASYAATPSMVVVNDREFSHGGTVLKRGGDNTVPAWSPLLTGFKWIYEMKNTPSYTKKIRLIEYCSRLAKDGKYKYDPNKTQKFAVLGCSCLNSNNEYENSVGDCSHAQMINDQYLIDYVNSIVDDPTETNTVTFTKRDAARSYDENIKYDNVCNLELKRIFESGD